MSFATALDNPRIFEFTQRLNPWTVRLYRQMLETHVVRQHPASVLDIGCGVGAHRPLFQSIRYTGIDINERFVTLANQRYGGGFRVMDAANLDFQTGAFEAVFTAATCHHLDDESLERLVTGAMRVVTPGGALHIIDPVLPVSSNAIVKQLVFSQDAGRHQRTLSQLTKLVARHSCIEYVDLRRGLLHDVCYIRLSS